MFRASHCIQNVVKIWTRVHMVNGPKKEPHLNASNIRRHTLAPFCININIWVAKACAQKLTVNNFRMCYFFSLSLRSESYPSIFGGKFGRTRPPIQIQSTLTARKCYFVCHENGNAFQYHQVLTNIVTIFFSSLFVTYRRQFPVFHPKSIECCRVCPSARFLSMNDDKRYGRRKAWSE